MLLERLMRVLTPRERLVLTLRFHDDLTQAQIGEMVGVSQMHVSRLVRNAIAKLTATSLAAQRLCDRRAEQQRRVPHSSIRDPTAALGGAISSRKRAS